MLLSLFHPLRRFLIQALLGVLATGLLHPAWAAESRSAANAGKQPDYSAVRRGNPMVLGLAVSIQDGAAAMKVAKSTGATSVRMDAPWKSIEVSQGRYEIPSFLQDQVDAAVRERLAPVLILAYGHPLYGGDKPKTPEAREAFARYAEFVVRHFKGQVGTYQLWNEWNSTAGGTKPDTPENYLALAKVVVPRLRSADSAIKIISVAPSGGGVRGGWLRRLIELDGYTLFDGLAAHPYNWYAADARDPESAMDSVDALAALAKSRNGGRQVDFYITEMGWTTARADKGVSPSMAAAYLARFCLQAAARPYIRGVWWYGLYDQGATPKETEHHFGLMDRKGTPYPSLAAFEQVAAVLSNTDRFEAWKEGGRVTMRASGGSGGSKDRWIAWPGSSGPTPGAAGRAFIRGAAVEGDEAPRFFDERPAER